MLEMVQLSFCIEHREDDREPRYNCFLALLRYLCLYLATLTWTPISFSHPRIIRRDFHAGLLSLSLRH